MIRILRWAITAIVLATLAACVVFRVLPDDPSAWHVDPATVERTGKPNDFLTGPPDISPDQETTVVSATPRELLFLFDAVARNAPRVTVLAGSLEELHITYVQRSAVFGFPDYISVKAVPEGDGARLIAYSRSRYGYSDLGVNKDRVEGWISQIAAPGG